MCFEKAGPKHLSQENTSTIKSRVYIDARCVAPCCLLLTRKLILVRVTQDFKAGLHSPILRSLNTLELDLMTLLECTAQKCIAKSVTATLVMYLMKT